MGPTHDSSRASGGYLESIRRLPLEICGKWSAYAEGVDCAFRAASSSCRACDCLLHLAHGSFQADEKSPRNDAEADVEFLDSGDFGNRADIVVIEPVAHVYMETEV